ncbi:MAG: peroxiredoxin [Legionella sp.]|nr:MAG: peroxiredoxin [Legionella sp.]
MTHTACELASTGNQTIRLQDYLGQWIVLYFYPKDATPGCTTEGQNFRDAHADFLALNTVIFGVSRDSVKSHETFKQKQQFPFDLLSDGDEALCQQFDVIKLKNMYGKQVRGIERSTFLIDPTGVIRHEWRKVKVDGHVADVYKTLVALQK